MMEEWPRELGRPALSSQNQEKRDGEPSGQAFVHLEM